MDNIGIIGQGYVGTAVRSVFENKYKIFAYDKYSESKSTVKNLGEILHNCNVIFICVPTPMNNDGSCSTQIVEDVLRDLNNVYEEKRFINKQYTIAIKSTIPPGTTEMLDEKYKGKFGIVFNPEFLTEANFIEDFKNQSRIIIGGKRPYSTQLRSIYSKVFPNTTIIKTGSKTAEMVKYMTNTFLATKVSFANEMYQICERLGIDYDKVVEYSTYDERLGKSHWAVPGPDGKFGFGGSCFPKDINALIKVAEDLKVVSFVLDGAWETNLNVRPERDWEELKGRAVVNYDGVVEAVSKEKVESINKVKFGKKGYENLKKQEEMDKKAKKDDNWELKA